MTGVDESEQRARLAALQRALYRPGATDADRERYLTLRDELARSDAVAAPRSASLRTEDDTPLAVPDSPRSARSAARRRLLVTGGLLLGVVAAAALIAVAQSDADGTDPIAGPTTAAPVQPLTAASGPSRRFSGDTAWTPAPEPRPTTVEVAVDDANVLAQRFSGSGTTVVPLITGSAPLDGGHLTVRLYSSASTPVSWRAEGGAGRSSAQVVVASTPEFEQAAPAPSTVGYRGSPPARIVVQAPAATRWTMIVAFTR